MGVELYVAGLLSGVVLAELVAWSRGRLKRRTAEPEKRPAAYLDREKLLAAAAALEAEWERTVVRYPALAADARRRAEKLRAEAESVPVLTSPDDEQVGRLSVVG